MRQNLKSINELRTIPYPDCFHQCVIAQMSENAYACCEVHCLEKICDSSFEKINTIKQRLLSPTDGSKYIPPETEL